MLGFIPFGWWFIYLFIGGGGGQWDGGQAEYCYHLLNDFGCLNSKHFIDRKPLQGRREPQAEETALPCPINSSDTALNWCFLSEISLPTRLY